MTTGERAIGKPSGCYGARWPLRTSLIAQNRHRAASQEIILKSFIQRKCFYNFGIHIIKTTCMQSAPSVPAPG